MVPRRRWGSSRAFLHVQRERDATTLRRDFDQRARFLESLCVSDRGAFKTALNAAVTTTCRGMHRGPEPGGNTVDAVAPVTRHCGVMPEALTTDVSFS